MKIVFISQNSSPGILIFRKDLIKLLVGQGYEVYCFALDYTPASKESVKSLGATPVDYRLNKSGLNPLTDLRDTLELAKKIKAIRPDIVLSFFVKPSIYGTLAAKLAGIPRRIAMLEGLGYIHTPSKGGDSLKKKVLRIVHGVLSTVGYAFADAVLFLNPDDPKDLSRRAFLNQKKLRVFGPIGLNLGEYPYVSIDKVQPIRFIFIARLLAEKGIFEYLAAARLVRQRYPDVEFIVLGGLDPDNPTALTPEQLQGVVDESVIIYPGHVSNVHEWIADSHVFVLPSYREGIPRSTQEAMAIGRAVITTNVPGCRETVIEGLNGFLVPPWDPQALAEKMLYFVEHPDEIRRMGEESHRLAVERYDVDKINSIFLGIIKENIGR